MAVTSTNSDLVANVVSIPIMLNPNNKSKGRLCLERFNCTQGAAAGDANSVFRLCKLPARARYVSALSFVRWSTFPASVVCAFGWEAYTNPFTQATIAANTTGLGSGLAVTTAGSTYLAGSGITSPLDEKEFENEVVITAIFTGATPAISAATTFNGHIAYLLG
jgi:hypothetical protein